MDLSDIDADSISQLPRDGPVLFLLSTYGEGDPSDNSIPFSEWLSSSLTHDSLNALRFAVLGFGNSNYKYYNQFARVTQEALEKGGAQPILPLHLADDAVGLTEEHFWSWVDELFGVLKCQYGFVETPKEYRSTVEISWSDDQPGPDISTPQFGKRATNFRTQSSLSAIRSVLVRKAVDLTPTSERTHFHLEVDIAEFPELKYDVGDHVGIWPQNPEDEVESLRRALAIEPVTMDKSLRATQIVPDTDIPSVLTGPTTLRTLFSRHLAVCNLVSRKLILDLQQFAPTGKASDRIYSISKDLESYEYHKKSFKMTLSAVLMWANDGSPWTIPLSYILEALPLLEPRYYSVASAPIVSPRRVSLAVTSLSMPLSNTVTLHGLASGYLRGVLESSGASAQGEVQARICCHIRKSKFKPPASPTQPMIMISTGSGIAPFRGFLQHRQRLQGMGRDMGRMILFFGCRNASEHIYEDELREIQKSLGGKLEIIIAYSRTEKAKYHVQDRIRERGEDVVKLITEQNAKTYLCGSTAMARGVKSAIGDLLGHTKDWSPIAVTEFLRTQSRMNQWQEDVWG